MARGETLLDRLPAGVRLPLRALIRITSIAFILAFAGSVLFLLYRVGIWVMSITAVQYILTGVLIAVGAYVLLLWLGATIEDNL